MADTSRFKRSVFFWIPVIILLAADQLTKYLAAAFLKDNAPFIVIDGILEFLYVENRGAAFGILYGMKYVFIILAIGVSAALFLYYCILPETSRLIPFKCILISITAGAMGNCIDRLRLGYVIDFIYFKPIDFPVFNFADILVTCSAFLMIFLFLFIYKEEDFKSLPFIGGTEKEPDEADSGPLD